MNMDTIISQGRIVDGTGNQSFVGDIGLVAGKIAAIAPKLEAEASRFIDASGLVVSPGFIDTHSHCDSTALVWPHLPNLVTQGTTTATCGNCGFSASPDASTWIDHTSRSFLALAAFWTNAYPSDGSWQWKTHREYVAAVNDRGTAVDLVPYIGHGTLRWQVGARDPVPATPEQLERMKALLRGALEDGAFGATAGLSYEPNRHASYDELVALARVCGENGRLYQLHPPYAGNAAGGRYAVSLARDAGVKMCIAHYQAMPRFWGEESEMLPVIDQARGEGLDVSFNVMPDNRFVFDVNGYRGIFFWIANAHGGRQWTVDEFSRGLADPDFRRALVELVKPLADLPYDIFPDFIELIPTAELARTGNPDLDGRVIGDVARELGVDPEEFGYDLIFGQTDLVPEGEAPVLVAPCAGSQEYLDEASSHEFGMPCTDLTPNELVDGGKSSPFLVGYNCMPQYLRDCRRRGVRLEEVVRHMTSLPASALNLSDRGILREGLKADVVIFDDGRFSPQATYEDVLAPASGLEWVFVGGEPVLEEGTQNGELPGRMISAA